MAPVLTALVLMVTVMIAMAIGVVTGYLIIVSILNAFARKESPKTAKPAPVLIAHGVSGD